MLFIVLSNSWHIFQKEVFLIFSDYSVLYFVKFLQRPFSSQVLPGVWKHPLIKSWHIVIVPIPFHTISRVVKFCYPCSILVPLPCPTWTMADHATWKSIPLQPLKWSQNLWRNQDLRKRTALKTVNGNIENTPREMYTTKGAKNNNWILKYR